MLPAVLPSPDGRGATSSDPDVPFALARDTRDVRFRRPTTYFLITSWRRLRTLVPVSVSKPSQERAVPWTCSTLATRLKQGTLQPMHQLLSLHAAGREGTGLGVANTLSIVLPSMSTISRCHPSQSTASPSLGSLPVMSISMPLRV